MKRKKPFRISILILASLLVAIVFAAQLTLGAMTNSATVAQPYAIYDGGIVQYYTCSRGNVASACEKLYAHAQSPYLIENGGLVQYYACTRGNVASACNALYGNSASPYLIENGGLVQYYACTRGNVASACDALYGNAPTS